MRTRSSIIVVIVLILFGGSRADSNRAAFFDHADAFFHRFVHDGAVDYSAILAEPDPLQDLRTAVERINLDDLDSPNADKAFWINVYNIAAISGILANYPVTSPQEITGFFSNLEYTVAGKRLTLDEIEKRLMESHADPRIHFAIVCAAKGCPVLQGRAYRPESLEEDLDARSKASVEDVRHVAVDRERETVFLSRLFDWYADDFSASRGSVLDFINAYRHETVPVSYSVHYTPYDWSLNETDVSAVPAGTEGDQRGMRQLTPSALLATGKFELKEFANLYTQTAYYDDDGTRVELDDRSTYFTLITQFLIGVSNRMSAGFDLYLKRVLNADADDSPFDILRFESTESSRTAITSIGPKVKVNPFEGLRSLSVQTMVLFPLHDDLEGGGSAGPFLDYDGLQWWTQLFYDRSFGDELLLYAEGDIFWRLEGAERLATPMKLILNYYPHDIWTLYVLGEFAPSWDGFDWEAYYGQVGLGMKCQFTERLEAETSWTVFPFGRNKGAGSTFNLGMRIVG